MAVWLPLCGDLHASKVPTSNFVAPRAALYIHLATAAFS